MAVFEAVGGSCQLTPPQFESALSAKKKKKEANASFKGAVNYAHAYEKKIILPCKMGVTSDCSAFGD